MTRLKSDDEDNDDFMFINVENNIDQINEVSFHTNIDYCEEAHDDENVQLLSNNTNTKTLQDQEKRQNKLLFNFVFVAFFLVFLILFLFSLIISRLEY